MTTNPKRSAARCPTHPGAVLRDIVLPALPMSKAEVARALGTSRQSLYDILAERKPVSPGMAVRLSLVLGTSAASWLNMQSAYDLWHAEREIDKSKLTSLKLAD